MQIHIYYIYIHKYIYKVFKVNPIFKIFRQIPSSVNSALQLFKPISNVINRIF